jgi:hypothetical protein
VLTYGSQFAGYGLLAATCLGWVLGAFQGWRWRHTAYGHELLLLASAALTPVAWVLFMPNHTVIHADFMVRMLVVPVSLAALVLAWPRAERAPALAQRTAFSVDGTPPASFALSPRRTV